MIQAVIFDMAGTTVDEQNIVYKTVQKAIQAAGYSVDLDTVLVYAAGREKLSAIEEVLLNLNANVKEAGAIFQDFKSRLKLAYEEEPIAMQPNAELVFRQLQTQKVSVVLNTGYDRTTVNQLLKRLRWDNSDLIDLTVCASDVQRGRPHPDMIELAMHKLGITDPKTIIKVGDSTVDIEEGLNANCLHSIGITTGAHTEEQLRAAKPTAIIHNLIEILDFL